MAKEPKQPEQQIFFGDMPLHELFQKQIAEVLLDREGFGDVDALERVTDLGQYAELSEGGHTSLVRIGGRAPGRQGPIQGRSTG